MNPQIEKLAEQCGFRSNPDVYDRNQSFDIPKFAELIVQECADVILKWKGEPFPFDEDLAVSLIKEHFGVKK